ncbi:RHS repeat-associated core domain-containing protein [Pseudomonas fluorescens]|uniref:RHS repeat-associated core domain-containing protein n=1 Tax=Pseudomonas fluorescens TaxID=294 RepID=A0A5E7CCY8_PSEFL|nr:RHS repeat-associated core domain-containing protein [Pseudomonas fluorescens]VVO02657.1 hypothetical protein PS723_02766 [Pseudomonas fluorescens]
MPTNRETLLCRYHYDPLDRLAACTLSKQASTQRFYLKTRLATEIRDQVRHSIFQHEDQLLAQQQRLGSTTETTLLATDQQRSVLNALDATRPHPLAYTPYGHRPPENGLLSLLGFNGEQPDPVTGHYLLGNGYRAFNPVLMRFNSPDNMSPFGKGGLNPYAYALGDPINGTDPTGHWTFRGIWGSIKGVFGFGKSSRATNTTQKFETTPPKNNNPASTHPSPPQVLRPSQSQDAMSPQVKTLASNSQISGKKTGSRPFSESQSSLTTGLAKRDAAPSAAPPTGTTEPMTRITAYSLGTGEETTFPITIKQRNLYRSLADAGLSAVKVTEIVRKGTGLPEGYLYRP